MGLKAKFGIIDSGEAVKDTQGCAVEFPILP
jgi:hypothetical protein